MAISNSRGSLRQWEEEHGKLWLFPGSPLFPKFVPFSTGVSTIFLEDYCFMVLHTTTHFKPIYMEEVKGLIVCCGHSKYLS